MRNSLFSQNRHMTTSDSSSRILDVDRFEKVRRELMSRLGVTSKPHRFGGTEFQVKGREMGHMHGGRFADFPFPMSVRNELVKGGREWSQQRGSPIQWIRFQFRTWMHLKPLLTLGIMLRVQISTLVLWCNISKTTKLG